MVIKDVLVCDRCFKVWNQAPLYPVPVKYFNVDYKEICKYCFLDLQKQGRYKDLVLVLGIGGGIKDVVS